MDISTKKIQQLMASHSLSKAALEKQCGLANGIIGRWEKGDYNPSRKALEKLSEFFDKPIEFFFSESPEPTQKIQILAKGGDNKVIEVSAEEYEDITHILETMRRTRERENRSRKT